MKAKPKIIVYYFNPDGELQGSGTLDELSAKTGINRQTIQSALNRRRMVKDMFYFSRSETFKAPMGTIYCYDTEDKLVAFGTPKYLAARLNISKHAIESALQRGGICKKIYYFRRE